MTQPFPLTYRSPKAQSFAFLLALRDRFSGLRIDVLRPSLLVLLNLFVAFFALFTLLGAIRYAFVDSAPFLPSTNSYLRVSPSFVVYLNDFFPASAAFILACMKEDMVGVVIFYCTNIFFSFWEAVVEAFVAAFVRRHRFFPPRQKMESSIVLPQKIRLCRHYERGYCKRGASCNFAHGLNDLNLKTTAQIVYGIERPSSNSPKPHIPLSSVISNEPWEHVKLLDSPHSTSTLECSPASCRSRDPRLAGGKHHPSGRRTGRCTSTSRYPGARARGYPRRKSSDAWPSWYGSDGNIEANCSSSTARTASTGPGTSSAGTSCNTKA